MPPSIPPSANAPLTPTAGSAQAGQSALRILVVDDDLGVRFTLSELLSSEGFTVAQAADGTQALELYDQRPFPLVITDLRMRPMDGNALLQALMTRSAPPKVVVITAHGSERQAVEAVKAGAFDYFRKPFDNDELLTVVRRALDNIRLVEENERLQGELALSRCLIFDSEPMRRLAVLVGRVAPRNTTVLISGESGTGKERVAEAIVRASARATGPYVRFNCAALSPELVEAELFGHAKGAFTGAHRARPGLFREADHGTILLDEVGELAPSTQAKLLRVLQEGEVRAVGEEQSRPIDVRILAATHRELEQLVREGRFRDDLYYRLNVVTLRVPPLRERADDIALLARHFLDRYAERFGLGHFGVSQALLDRLNCHRWPGNVRELENAIESLVVLSPPGELDLSLLPGQTPSPDPRRTNEGAPHEVPETAGVLNLKQRMDAYERGLLVDALEQARNNKSLAAQRLGISRVTLHDKLNKHGIGRDASDAGDEA
jgi:DNA-binding NtrC family response regulator